MGKSLDDDFSDLTDIVADGETDTPSPETWAKPVATEQTKYEERAAVREEAASRPSPYQSELRARLKKRRQFALGDVPEFVHEEYARIIKEKGMKSKRELLYHFLREEGADIPPYEQMDRRASH